MVENKSHVPGKSENMDGAPEFVRENTGFLNQIGQVMGKAVDAMLSRMTFGRDPMDFDPAALTGKARADKATELAEAGRRFLDEGNLSTALTYLEGAFSLEPGNDWIALTYLLSLCNSPRDFGKLLGLRDRLEAMAKTSAPPQYAEIRAAMEYIGGSTPDARVTLGVLLDNRRVFETFAGNLLAGILLFEADPAGARDYFVRAAVIFPDDPSVHRCLVRCHRRLGELAEAATEERILRILEGSPGAPPRG